MHAGLSLLPLVLDRVSYAVNGVPLINELSVTLTGGQRTVILGPKDRKSTRLNSSHTDISRMPSSA